MGLGVLAGILVRSGERDEWIDVGDYLDAVRVCAKMIVVWCGCGWSAELSACFS